MQDTARSTFALTSFVVTAHLGQACARAPVTAHREERSTEQLGEPAPKRAPDVPYEPSPRHVVTEMLKLAELKSGDVVYDLGCGDGRIVIAAVQTPGVRGVCIDIDPARIRESRQNAAASGVSERIEFRTEDLFEAEIKGASVVTLFLWPEVNLKLRPKLERELSPGTRVISYMHDMGDWQPDQTAEVVAASGRHTAIYLFHIKPSSGPPR